jgi:hypothetical protein
MAQEEPGDRIRNFYFSTTIPKAVPDHFELGIAQDFQLIKID